MSDQAQSLRALADQSRRAPLDLAPNYPENDAVATTDAPRSLRSQNGSRSVHEASTFDLSPWNREAVADARILPGHISRQQFTLDDGNQSISDAHRLYNIESDITGASHKPMLSASPVTPARIIAVTSGKGGVGKTNFSSNLSLTLARTGQRVIVLDADLGLANLHVILGISPPYSLEHVLRGEKRMSEILCDGPGGIQILGGGSGITELANLDESARTSFITGVRELDTLADVIVIDTGAGLSRNVLAFLCATEEIIVVTTPEPTAITDAYATIKVVSKENPAARIMLVVNMAQSEEEAAAAAHRLIRISHQFLGITIDWIGSVPHDPAVARAVRAQQPFSIAYPSCSATRGLNGIAEQLGYRPTSLPPSGGMGGLLSRMQRFFGARAA